MASLGHNELKQHNDIQCVTKVSTNHVDYAKLYHLINTNKRTCMQQECVSGMNK